MIKNTLSSLSRTEVELIARLSYEERDIVTAREMDAYLPSSFPYRNQLVYSLKKKRVLIPIKNGVYIFVPFDAISTGRRVNEFLIPKAFFPRNDYYIGYSTMFNYYSFTDQQFQTVYVLNPRISRERTIAGVNFKFMKIPPERMYGLEKITVKGKEVVVSSKERTLIDLIYYNQPVGGIDAASGILEQFVKEKKCDIKKLIDLAVRFPKIKTRKRIGITLEETGVSKPALKALERSVKGTALISFSKSRKGRLNKRWGAIVQNPRG